MPIDLKPYQEIAIKIAQAGLSAQRLAPFIVPKDRIIVVNEHTDFAEIERRVMAAMALDGEVFIDLEPSGGFIDGSSFVKQRLCDIMPEPEPPGPPMKQNGRSAAYLKHDHTKQHRRRR